jgi:hypothetical protein
MGTDRNWASVVYPAFAFIRVIGVICGSMIFGRVFAKSIFVFQYSLHFATAAARIYREIKAQCVPQCGKTRVLLGICGAFLGIIGTIFGVNGVQ